MLHTLQQLRYYQGVVLPKITTYFNETHKKWYLIKIWKPEYTHNWMKRYYFSDRSTKEIEYDEWEEIMKKIRVDFSKYVWIQKSGDSNEVPIYN